MLKFAAIVAPGCEKKVAQECTSVGVVTMPDTRWARPDIIPPYHIYVKMAYHLAEEARAGLDEFSLPKEFREKLFDFQAAAVKIAARHLEKRGETPTHSLL